MKRCATCSRAATLPASGRTWPMATVQAEFDYVQQAREEGPNIVQAFHDSMAQKGGAPACMWLKMCAPWPTPMAAPSTLASAPIPNSPPVGVPEPERAVRELQTAIAHQLTPQSACTVDTLVTRGKKIIRILVPRGDDPRMRLMTTRSLCARRPRARLPCVTRLSNWSCAAGTGRSR